jgi:hypothetical protein
MSRMKTTRTRLFLLGVLLGALWLSVWRSLEQDWMGQAAYIEHARNDWTDAKYSVPIALFGGAWALLRTVSLLLGAMSADAKDRPR